MRGIASYPSDFIVSCGIRRVRPEVFLQYFVNQFYYSALFCETRSRIEFAVNIIIYSNFMKNQDWVPRDQDKALHVICKEQLDEIIDDPATAESTKRALLVPVLKKFSEAICQDPEQASRISLPDGCTLRLPDSLIVLCFLYGVLPEIIIKELVDNISVTMLYAIGKPLLDGKNHYMEVFYRITNDLSQSTDEPDDLQHEGYEEMLKELYEQMREELDINIRYNRFRIHFRKWYNSLKHIEIKPIVL